MTIIGLVAAGLGVSVRRRRTSAYVSMAWSIAPCLIRKR